MRRFVVKNWFGLISFVLSAGVLLFAAAGIQKGGDMTEIIKNIRLVWLGAAMVCLLMYWVLDSYILLLITKVKYGGYGLIQSVKTCMIGLLYNALTPFAVGGQPMQVVVMAKDGIDVGDASSFITVKSIIYQVCLTGYAIFSIFITASFLTQSVPNFSLFIAIGLVLNTIFIIIVFLICVHDKLTLLVAGSTVSGLAWLKIIKNRERTMEKVKKQIEMFHGCFLLLHKEKKAQVIATIGTIVQLTCYYSIPYCIYRGMGLSGTTALFIICVQAIITMVTAFVPIPGAAGAAEGSFYLFFSLIFTHVTVLPAIILWRVLTYYSCIIVGGAVSLACTIRPTQ